MSFLSPCVIIILLIIGYTISGEKNRRKINDFYNKNNKVVIGSTIVLFIYLFYNNLEGFFHDGDDENDESSCNRN